MAVAAAASAVIQTIGIIMLSTQLSTDHHVVALIPAVPNNHAAKIDAHTALLAIPAADYVSNRDWPLTTFQGVDGMLWVPLNGERISFRTSRPRLPDGSGPGLGPGPGSAATARRAGGGTPGTVAPDLGLPHLQTKCCRGTKLLADFIPPEGSGMPPQNQLAAVVDFPPASAELACNGTALGRVDTLVTLPSSDYVTIVSVRGRATKEIRVKGGARIYIANLPSWFIKNPYATASHGPEHHYEVYYAMVGGTATSCGDWRACATGAAAVCTSQFLRTSQAPPTPFDVWANARIDIECSNSQWP